MNVQEVIDATPADVQAAVSESDRADEALNACIKGRVGWDASLDAIDAVNNTGVDLRCAYEERIGRIVGAYLIEHGHEEIWRTLYPILVAVCDVGNHSLESYAYRAEVRFIEEAGQEAREAPKVAGLQLVGGKTD
jgi:hypothetical protein